MHNVLLTLTIGGDLLDVYAGSAAQVDQALGVWALIDKNDDAAVIDYVSWLQDYLGLVPLYVVGIAEVKL